MVLESLQLLRIIAGEEEADEGKIIFSNGLTVGWLGQNPEFDEDSSILKYVCEGKRLKKIMDMRVMLKQCLQY